MRRNATASVLLDLLYPRRCPWCNNVIGFTECIGCDSLLEPLRLPPRPVEVSPETGAFLEEAWACYRYKPPVSQAILRFKLKDGGGHGDSLGKHLARLFENAELAGKYDLILPVPMSPKAERNRGYNQSALLAGALARNTGWPRNGKILRKIKETRRQMDLTREERLDNILGAYAVIKPGAVSGRHILLVDDVLTTGATLNECARTLLAAGAKSCGAICLASA